MVASGWRGFKVNTIIMELLLLEMEFLFSLLQNASTRTVNTTLPKKWLREEPRNLLAPLKRQIPMWASYNISIDKLQCGWKNLVKCSEERVSEEDLTDDSIWYTERDFSKLTKDQTYINTDYSSNNYIGGDDVEVHKRDLCPTVDVHKLMTIGGNN